MKCPYTKDVCDKTDILKVFCIEGEAPLERFNPENDKYENMLCYAKKRQDVLSFCENCLKGQEIMTMNEYFKGV